VFVYDGDCAFCSSCARFITRLIPTTATVAAWQHLDLAALGLTEEECERAVRWVPADGAAGRASADVAIGRMLVDAGSFWRLLGRLALLPPGSWLAGPVYRLVARNRHRLPGGTPACALPPEKAP
jgi:predicted DCC family thiol-disulfide oxidoreductase YuxK